MHEQRMGDSPWPNVPVGLDKNNPYKYDITKYVYAASDVPSKTQKVKESTWIGFVGVATDEGKVALGRRDILIAWRGTRRGSEWNDDCENSLVQPTEIFGEKTNNILVHKERGLIDGFANDRRVYEDVGFELSIDTTKSKYLKKDVDGHILEVYLHGTAGTQGAKGEFKLEINRDIALKNKADDVLKDEYGVPVSWCIEKNKGMVQQEDGSWILMDHEDYDTYFLP
ncbi:Phospholipase A1-II 1 [Capsicum chinense]|nr:Phospholipase A1-II 1 [Capsicum chinense]